MKREPEELRNIMSGVMQSNSKDASNDNGNKTGSKRTQMKGRLHVPVAEHLATVLLPVELLPESTNARPGGMVKMTLQRKTSNSSTC